MSGNVLVTWRLTLLTNSSVTVDTPVQAEVARRRRKAGRSRLVSIDGTGACSVTGVKALGLSTTSGLAIDDTGRPPIPVTINMTWARPYISGSVVAPRRMAASGGGGWRGAGR